VFNLDPEEVARPSGAEHVAELFPAKLHDGGASQRTLNPLIEGRGKGNKPRNKKKLRFF
jgi:hypothetical protein